MGIDYTVQVWQEGGQFVAHAMPLDVMSAGPTPQAAKDALAEAVNLFLRTAADHGTLEDVLEECGYERQAEGWISPTCVAVERQSASVAV